ncbi:MAG: alpha/beta hydrolase [Chloroflexi bacterium]|nr:alpha/beta hydrolase [Chloroflexota bacterium]
MSAILMVFVVLAVLIGVLLSAAALAKRRVRAGFARRGRLVDVGGFHLYLREAGDRNSRPTVIFDAGAGGSSPHWAGILPEIAQDAHVIAYDRAGLGWSESSPNPRTAEVMADELHALLEAAGIPAPYVMVGHSLGGRVSTTYAHRYPGEVAGMVLVDAGHQDQFFRFPPEIREISARMFRAMPVGLFRWVGRRGLLALRPSLVPVEKGMTPEAVVEFRAAQATNTAMAVTIEESTSIMVTAPEQITSVGNIPLVVLSHGIPFVYDKLPDAVNQAYESVWQELQSELTALSPQGKRIVAEKSGHNIMLDQPELVIAAIRDVLTAVRQQHEVPEAIV